MYTVAIKKHSDDSLLKTIGSSTTQRGLERIENGVNINLNHDEYYTEIVDKDDIEGE